MLVRLWRDHSLSLVLTGLWWGLTAAAFLLPEGPAQEYLHNLSGDAFGAFVIVVLTKWLRERGSAESK